MAANKENIEAPQYWPFVWGESTGQSSSNAVGNATLFGSALMLFILYQPNLARNKFIQHNIRV